MSDPAPRAASHVAACRWALQRACPITLSVVVWGCQPTASNAPPVQPSPGRARSEIAPEGLLPVRLRRLSNREYAQTLSKLLGFEVQLPASFPEDVRLKGFSSNDRQAVDVIYLAEAQRLARGLAKRAVRERFRELVPCEPVAPDCARRSVIQFATRAYRRAPRAEELAAALRLFNEAATVGGFETGLEQLIATLLVAPQLSYVSEVGTPVGPGVQRLTSAEAASVLAYMLTGSPPDEALRQAGDEGRLDGAEQRREQAWRLLAQPDTRYQFRRFVREWLGLDALENMTRPVADDRRLRLGLLAETDAFVDDVFMYEGASLDKLLQASFTVIPASLRRFEGLPPAQRDDEYGRVSLAGSGRLGLLQQPSFLAVLSHEGETAPVLRGKAILERFLCRDLPRPTELGIVVSFPLPDPRLTTRERHAQHDADATCRSCHRTIDALGFPFENFDFIGRLRTEENGRPIDTHTDYDGPEGPRSFRDSQDVARWLAESPLAHECFARQAFRFFSGNAEPAVEAAFLTERERLPEARRRDLFEDLVAFVASPMFMERRLVEGNP